MVFLNSLFYKGDVFMCLVCFEWYKNFWYLLCFYFFCYFCLEFYIVFICIVKEVFVGFWCLLCRDFVVVFGMFSLLEKWVK